MLKNTFSTILLTCSIYLPQEEEKLKDPYSDELFSFQDFEELMKEPIVLREFIQDLQGNEYIFLPHMVQNARDYIHEVVQRKVTRICAACNKPYVIKCRNPDCPRNAIRQKKEKI